MPAVSVQAQDSPILEYHRFSLKLAQRDDTPQLRVYASGRVETYFPAYSNKPGRYEMQLSQNELAAFLQTLRAGGLLQLTTAQVRADAETAERMRRQRGGELFYSSDATVTRMHVRFVGTPELNLEARNLQSEARRLPQAAIVNRMAALERQLWKLRDDSRLRRFAGPLPLPGN